MMRALAIAMVVLLALPAAAVTARDARKAKALYRGAQRAYKKGDFLGAVQLFKRGHHIDPRPAFLLNIAQSYRMAKKPREAIDFYRQFLDASPATPLRAQVEGLIAELRTQLPKPPRVDPSGIDPPGVDHSGKDPSKKPPAFAQTDPPITPTKPTTAEPFYKKWWFWTAVGVLVVGTATGVGVAAANSGGPDYVKEGGLGSVRW